LLRPQAYHLPLTYSPERAVEENRAGRAAKSPTIAARWPCLRFRRTDPPSLLILDEPTNHLDIDSIEAVEAGLRAYDGALLVVSHDEAFLANSEVSRRLELPSGVETMLPTLG
jgi:hypothetical protein